MRKKITFMVVCVVLLLIFTSSGYGGGNGKYVLLAHPWGHMESPSLPQNQDLDVHLFIISPNWVLLLNHPHNTKTVRKPQFDNSIKLNHGTNEKSLAR